MAYNNRMSMAGSQQHHNRTRKKEDDNDALMRLVSRALELDAQGVTRAITDVIVAR
jgi:hypothetical protein